MDVREQCEAEDVARLTKDLHKQYPDVQVTTDVVRDNAVLALIKAARHPVAVVPIA